MKVKSLHIHVYDYKGCLMNDWNLAILHVYRGRPGYS